jgi:hypothetical protein
MPGIDNYSLDNYGLDGFDKNADLELIASGSATNDTSIVSTNRFEDDTSYGNLPFLRVDYNFGHILPNLILVTIGNGTRAVFIRGLKNVRGNSFVLFFTGNGLVELSANGGGNYVNSTGFRLAVSTSNTAYNWKAYV